MPFQQILEATSDEEAEILRARLTELQVEHCCLCNLMITSNTRLFGPWKLEWNPHKELKDDICNIMVRLCATIAPELICFNKPLHRMVRQARFGAAAKDNDCASLYSNQEWSPFLDCSHYRMDFQSMTRVKALWWP